MTEKHVSTLVINPGGGGSSSGGNSVQTTQSGSFSSTTSISKQAGTTTSQTGSTTKTVSSMTTTKKTSTSSVKKMSMTSSSVISSSSNKIAIQSSGDTFGDILSKELGSDMHKEMEKMRLNMDDAVQKAKSEMFSLVKLDKIGSAGITDTIKLDNSSISSFVDKAHDDRLKFNFDVDEFESETISVRTDGNKIEVQGKKKARKGEDETSEEFSRTYEMPTQTAIDSSKVTSSFYKDGILTVELPYNK